MPVIAFLIACYGLWLRLMHLHGREFWWDEVYQFDHIHGPFKPFWLHCHYGDFTTFPGEYIHYPLVELFGMNKWILAIPHLILTVAGFYFLYLLCCRYMKTWVGFASAFLLFSLNNNLIFHSLEFRPYGALSVFALACLWIAHRLADGNEGMSWQAKSFMALSIIFMINYHAYGIVIFLLPLLFVFINQRTLPWKFLGLTLAIAFPIWVWYASYDHFGLTKNMMLVNKFKIYPFKYFADPLIDPFSFLKSVIGNLLGNRYLYVLLPPAFLSLVFPHSQRFKQWVFLLLLIILPLVMIFYTDVRSNYWFLQRQFTWVMSFFALWLGWCLDTLFLYLKELRQTRALRV